MKKIVVVLILCLGFSQLQAQEVYNSSGKKGEAKYRSKKQSGFDPSRLIWGGGIGLGFGDGMFYGSISPVVGYAITDHFAAGVGLSYQYYSNKYEPAYDYYGNYLGTYKMQSSMYIGSLWARYVIWKNLFAQVEPQILNVDDYHDAYLDYNGKVVNVKREWVPAALVGLGIRQPITDRASVILLAMYDVLQNSNTPYYRTIDFRIGFNIGF
jgi:hypothetical protein